MKSVEHRIEIYKLVSGFLGRELTDKEHAQLKEKMYDYLKEHGAELSIVAKGGHQYIYTCRDCQKQKSALGKAAKKEIKGTSIKEIKSEAK